MPTASSRVLNIFLAMAERVEETLGSEAVEKHWQDASALEGQRTGTFASAATNTGQATLLTRRESSGLNGYLIVPAAKLGTNAPLHLAHTVGARAEETQMPEDLGDTPAIGTLTYKPSPALRETQAGIDRRSCRGCWSDMNDVRRYSAGET